MLLAAAARRTIEACNKAFHLETVIPRVMSLLSDHLNTGRALLCALPGSLCNVTQPLDQETVRIHV